MRRLLLMSALFLSSCVRSAGVPPAQLGEDKSLVIPMFFGVRGTDIDDQGRVFEMDSTTLRALTTATRDFLPSGSPDTSCWTNPEGHRYAIIRQGNVVFIDIGMDLVNCKPPFLMFDYGAIYAISTDGHILRRVFPGDLDYPNPLRESDAGVAGVTDDRDYSDVLGATWGSSHIAIPLSWLDGGFPRSRLQAAPDGGVQSDSGLPDGGLPDGGLPDGGLPDGGLPDGGPPVVFPELFGVERTAVSEQGRLYRMEGITFRALLTAIDDFRLTSSQGHPCGSASEDLLYRIFDQGKIIFIEITPNTSNCKPGSLMVAHGVKYAISPEGHILRRISSGDPGDVPALKPSDAGVAGDGGPWPDGGLLNHP